MALAQFEVQKQHAANESSQTGSMVNSDGLFDDIEYEKGIDFMLNHEEKVLSARVEKETN